MTGKTTFTAALLNDASNNIYSSCVMFVVNIPLAVYPANHLWIIYPIQASYNLTRTVLVCNDTDRSTHPNPH